MTTTNSSQLDKKLSPSVWTKLWT